MIALLIALGALLFMSFLAIAVGAWILNEHRLANKYRALVRLHLSTPLPSKQQTGWKFTYKDRKGKLVETVINKENQGEATAEIVRMGIVKIMSIEKVG